MRSDLVYKPFGDRAILIEWPTQIDELILKDIIQFKEGIILSYEKKYIEDIVIGYNSLTIVYVSTIADFFKEKEILTSIYKSSDDFENSGVTLWRIPVCYDEVFGIDLEEMAVTLQLSKEDIIRLHTQTIYTVYFIGFLPGFLYLGGLLDELKIKRKSTPRLSVAKGSVAIGGAQTGIYPMDSAGGWNIMGKTPISFFNTSEANPCFAKSGDKIQFIPISIAEFNKLTLEIELGIYELEKTVIND